MASTPKTLTQAIQYFTNPDHCIDYLAVRRWPNGVSCPTCGRTDVAYVPSRRLWQCKTRHPKAQFSVKTGTLLEDSPLGLDKWLPVMWMVANCKNGVSSWEIHRSLGVTQKTAWFMLHRIRLGMQDETGGMLGGEVEVDETFIGGKARNMHKSKRLRLANTAGSEQLYGGKGKTVVMGVLERGGKIKASVIRKRMKEEMQGFVRDSVEKGATVMTDEARQYLGIADDYVHEVINHAETYVRGQVHTNGIENFWSLLKRGLNGTYVSVEPFHLFRYIDEQAFRFNNRATRDNKITDADRFSLLCSQIAGKRLTYAELTAKEGEKPEVPF
jgi:transposase-like protein